MYRSDEVIVVWRCSPDHFSASVVLCYHAQGPVAICLERIVFLEFRLCLFVLVAVRDIVFLSHLIFVGGFGIPLYRTIIIVFSSTQYTDICDNISRKRSKTWTRCTMCVVIYTIRDSQDGDYFPDKNNLNTF